MDDVFPPIKQNDKHRLKCKLHWLRKFIFQDKHATQCIAKTLTVGVKTVLNCISFFSCYKRLVTMLVISLVFIGGTMSLTRLQKALWYRKVM